MRQSKEVSNTLSKCLDIFYIKEKELRGPGTSSWLYSLHVYEYRNNNA